MGGVTPPRTGHTLRALAGLRHRNRPNPVAGSPASRARRRQQGGWGARGATIPPRPRLATPPPRASPARSCRICSARACGESSSTTRTFPLGTPPPPPALERLEFKCSLSASCCCCSCCQPKVLACVGGRGVVPWQGRSCPCELCACAVRGRKPSTARSTARSREGGRGALSNGGRRGPALLARATRPSIPPNRPRRLRGRQRRGLPRHGDDAVARVV